MFSRQLRHVGRRPILLRRNVSVFDKYKAQLELEAQKKGISLSDLLKQSQPKIEELKTEKIADPVKHVSDPVHKKLEKMDPIDPTTAEAIRSSTQDSDKFSQELGSFIDVDKFAKHTKEEIEMLWKARFLNSDSQISGTLDAAVFSRLYLAARQFPVFVLPLPHKEHGIELHYVQWNFTGQYTIYCLLTSLAEYKLHGEYAHPHTTVMVHSNFVMDKGVALTNSIVQTNRIPLDDAVLLVLNLKRFYGADPASPHSKEKIELLRQFNQGDVDFSVDKLISAAETLD